MRWMTLLVLSSCLGCAGKTVSPERMTELGAIQFRYYVTVAGKAMNIHPPPAINLTDDILNGDESIPASIYQLPTMPALFSASPQFVIRIRRQFLRDYPVGGLEHAATHEICHAKLGHLNASDDDDSEEFEAERCTYYFMGDEKYVTFFMNHAKWHFRNNGNYEAFASLNYEEMLQHIRSAFRIDADTPRR